MDTGTKLSPCSIWKSYYLFCLTASGALSLSLFSIFPITHCTMLLSLVRVLGIKPNPCPLDCIRIEFSTHTSCISRATFRSHTHRHTYTCSSVTPACSPGDCQEARENISFWAWPCCCKPNRQNGNTDLGLIWSEERDFAQISFVSFHSEELESY